MESRKIFSKLNIKDYNNELEKILDNKLFSLDVKNILLSMLYKIENAYKDYSTIKIEVLPKKDFIEYLLKIIKDKCFEIEFLKPSQESNEPEKNIIIDNEKGKILCYPNEKSLLSAIWYMGEQGIEYEPIYKYTKEAINDLIYIGNNMNQVEVIRDFNGWSWDIAVKEIESISYNILYQSLLMIYGKDISYINIDCVPNTEEEENILKKERDKKEDEILSALSEVAMKVYMRKHEDVLSHILKTKNEKEQEYALFQDKKKFIQVTSDKKKEYSKQIEKIDKIINNTTLLRNEYNKRNEKLPNKEKIFSISHLSERLEKERNQLLEKLKECNKILEPREFVAEKEKKRKEVEFLNHLDLEEKDNIKESIIQFCKLIIKEMEEKIERIEERGEIIRWIYKVRYYASIPFNKEKDLKDITELDKDFERIIKLTIKKAQQNKILEVFSEDENLTYKVLKEVFYSKIIDFQNINMVCKYENGILYVQYYDGNSLEKKTEIQMNHIKIKKKFKMFV